MRKIKEAEEEEKEARKKAAFDQYKEAGKGELNVAKQGTDEDEIEVREDNV